MTLRSAYAWGFGLAVELGLLAVLLGGTLPIWTWPAVLVPAISAALQARGRALPGSIGTAIAIAGFVAAAVVVVAQGLEALLIGGGVALIGLLTGRLLTRQTLAHDLQALVLSLLLVFAGSVLHVQLTYGVIFVLYAIAAAWALVTRQLVLGATSSTRAAAGSLARRDVVTVRFAAVTAGLAVVILTTTSLLFVLFPRLGFTSLGLFARERFPTGVSLTGSPRAGGGGAVMARVWGLSYRAFTDGLYLRGPVYDQLTPDGFNQSPVPREQPPPAMAIPPDAERASYQVFVQPGHGQVLLTLGPVVRAYSISGGTSNPSVRQRILGTGPSGELMASGTVSGPLRYSVFGGLVSPSTQRARTGASEPLVGQRRERLAHYLALRQDLDPRIEALAGRLLRQAGVAAGTAPQKARVLRRHLLDNFDYSLAQPNGSAADPLAAFLFDDPRGHCEYFATAYATLLRAAGVPSRVIGGYAGGKWDGDVDGEGVVLFTRADAHAWVEFYDAELGWVADDATPATSAAHELLAGLAVLVERVRRTWDDYVVDYSVDDQFRVLGRVVAAVDSPLGALTERLRWWMVVGGLLAVAAFVGLYFGAQRLRRRAAGGTPALARALLAFVERRSGAPVAASCTVREAVEAVCGEMEQEKTGRDVALGALAAYERDRFSRRRLSAAEVRRRVAEVGRLGRGH